MKKVSWLSGTELDYWTAKADGIRYSRKQIRRRSTSQTFIRIVLSLLLIYGVYTETGIWTATFAILILVYAELNSLTIRLMNLTDKGEQEE